MNTAPRGPRGEPDPGRTERVLMLSLQDTEHRVRVLGALEDGTVFERDPVAGWRSVNNGGDFTLSFELMVMMVDTAERSGATMIKGPHEFGIDVGVTTSIRNSDFRDAGRLLDIAYDMASRAHDMASRTARTRSPQQ